MSDHTNWELQLNEYIRQGEPDQVDKSIAWKTAIGLQDVDGLKTSDYLIETAKEKSVYLMQIGVSNLIMKNEKIEMSRMRIPKRQILFL